LLLLFGEASSSSSSSLQHQDTSTTSADYRLELLMKWNDPLIIDWLLLQVSSIDVVVVMSCEAFFPKGIVVQT